MHEVGFEPTSLSTYDLKSYPLDHSGIRAFTQDEIRTRAPGGKAT